MHRIWTARANIRRGISARNRRGFTLIELSIVLVIIGLLTGGILIGRDLVNKAAERAQISQIERYNQAVNVFYGKYGALPGDMSAAVANQFGFATRGSCSGSNPGTGDGNGIISGTNGCTAFGTYESWGETSFFWADLSQAGLIEGSYTLPAFPGGGTGNVSSASVPSMDAYFPEAKLGTGNWILVFSMNGLNYFDLSNFSSTHTGFQPNGPGWSYPGISVLQAYDVDNKIDDGLPQTGRVTVQAVFKNTVMLWSSANFDGGGMPIDGGAPGTAISPSIATCYDNGGNASNPTQYSLSATAGYGSHMNCALSFQMQGAGR